MCSFYLFCFTHADLWYRHQRNEQYCGAGESNSGWLVGKRARRKSYRHASQVSESERCASMCDETSNRRSNQKGQQPTRTQRPSFEAATRLQQRTPPPFGRFRLSVPVAIVVHFIGALAIITQLMILVNCCRCCAYNNPLRCCCCFVVQNPTAAPIQLFLKIILKHCFYFRQSLAKLKIDNIY